MTGSDLYHNIARLNRDTRNIIPDSVLLDQLKKLVSKSIVSFNNIKYALRLIDVIELVVF